MMQDMTDQKSKFRSAGDNREICTDRKIDQITKVDGEDLLVVRQ